MANGKRAKGMSHGIRPPRKPRRENKAVTIANQDRQIKLLIDCCEELRKECDYRKEQYDRELSTFDKTAQDLNDRTLAYIRLQGYQDCAREIIGKFIWKDLPPFPSNATGG